MDLITNIILSFNIYDFIDIAIMTFIVYKALQLLRGTAASHMTIPIIFIIIALPLTKNIGLRTTSWMLSNFTGYFIIVVVVLFQPELRRALTSLGESWFFKPNKSGETQSLDEIVRATTILANRAIGALIVFQRGINLEKIVDKLGTKLDSEISKDLLVSIFITYSPMHDGAVIINSSRISYAACILPLSKREDLPDSYGTRHRAAVGITEVSDAVTIVVSEERGEITLVADGHITPALDADTLKTKLKDLFGNNTGKKS
jgi:uncharacterized protein (TIGR00159 family)